MKVWSNLNFTKLTAQEFFFGNCLIYDLENYFENGVG